MTQQIHERLVFEGERASVWPPPTLPVGHPRLIEQDLDAVGDPADRVLRSTACWRRYQGAWEIEGGCLFLTDVRGRFALLPGDPVFADWVHATLLVALRDRGVVEVAVQSGLVVSVRPGERRRISDGGIDFVGGDGGGQKSRRRVLAVGHVVITTLAIAVLLLATLLCGRGYAGDEPCAGLDVAGCFAEAKDLLRGDQAQQVRALGMLGSLCDSGGWEACSVLGVAAAKGLGSGAPDPASAAQWFDRACSGGSVEGCFNHATLLSKQAKSPRQRVDVRKLFEVACAGGVGQACGWLGRAYDPFLPEAGTWVLSNREMAKDYYGRACDLGAVQWCLEAVLVRCPMMSAASEPESPDCLRARILAGRGCDASVKGACNLLGVLLEAAGDFGGARVAYERECATFGGAACDALRSGRLDR